MKTIKDFYICLWLIEILFCSTCLSSPVCTWWILTDAVHWYLNHDIIKVKKHRANVDTVGNFFQSAVLLLLRIKYKYIFGFIYLITKETYYITRIISNRGHLKNGQNLTTWFDVLHSG